MNAVVVSSDITLKISKGEIGSENVNTIDARNLHKTLNIKRDFSTWIKSKLEKYGFQQDVDFSPELVKSNWRPRMEYILTLDTAKEIAMVENNEEWRKIRRYLIEVEKKWRKWVDKNDPDELLQKSISYAVSAGLLFREKTEKLNQFERMIEWIVDNKMKRI